MKRPLSFNVLAVLPAAIAALLIGLVLPHLPPAHATPTVPAASTHSVVLSTSNAMQSDLNAGGHAITNAAPSTGTNGAPLYDGTGAAAAAQTAAIAAASSNATNVATTQATNAYTSATNSAATDATTKANAAQAAAISTASANATNIATLQATNAYTGATNSAASFTANYVATHVAAPSGNFITESLSANSNATNTVSGVVSTDSITLNAGSGAYTVNRALAAGTSTNEVWEVPVSYPASTNVTLNVYDQGITGSPLLTATSTAIAGSTTYQFGWDGAHWNHFPKGALLTKNLGTGVQTALTAATNSTTGMVTIPGLASTPSGVGLATGPNSLFPIIWWGDSRWAGPQGTLGGSPFQLLGWTDRTPAQAHSNGFCLNATGINLSIAGTGITYANYYYDGGPSTVHYQHSVTFTTNNNANNIATLAAADSNLTGTMGVVGVANDALPFGEACTVSGTTVTFSSSSYPNTNKPTVTGAYTLDFAVGAVGFAGISMTAHQAMLQHPGIFNLAYGVNDAAYIGFTMTVAATATNGSPILTVPSHTVAGALYIPGMGISGTGIAGGATLLTDTDTTHITLSSNFTGTSGAVTITLAPTFQNFKDQYTGLLTKILADNPVGIMLHTVPQTYLGSSWTGGTLAAVQANVAAINSWILSTYGSVSLGNRTYTSAAHPTIFVCDVGSLPCYATYNSQTFADGIHFTGGIGGGEIQWTIAANNSLDTAFPSLLTGFSSYGDMWGGTVPANMVQNSFPTEVTFVPNGPGFQLGPAGGGNVCMGQFGLMRIGQYGSQFGYIDYNHSNAVVLGPTRAGTLSADGISTSNSTGTITFNTVGNDELIYDPSSTTIGSATITLPTAPRVNEEVAYVGLGTLSSITMAGGTVSIGAAPTSYTASSPPLIWKAISTSAWVRVQ